LEAVFHALYASKRNHETLDVFFLQITCNSGILGEKNEDNEASSF